MEPCSRNAELRDFSPLSLQILVGLIHARDQARGPSRVVAIFRKHLKQDPLFVTHALKLEGTLQSRQQDCPYGQILEGNADNGDDFTKIEGMSDEGIGSPRHKASGLRQNAD
jgi:hypothetical protein